MVDIEVTVDPGRVEVTVVGTPLTVLVTTVTAPGATDVTVTVCGTAVKVVMEVVPEAVTVDAGAVDTTVTGVPLIVLVKVTVDAGTTDPAKISAKRLENEIMTRLTGSDSNGNIAIIILRLLNTVLVEGYSGLSEETTDS